ncbi:N-acetylmuramoyl-L-alanine amidase [Paenibacillus psychroresistens]|uniref:N-acetylmuramoyl-L-alanine amidase n=1 Tax=Paenibacillus psychroresistens TaxID=1778678 RepID=A0A6B8RFV2_9BACL|nr:N-acetylmuramoyl-L-alanine amidase [Paenibacillus psychroresistens]QGQ95341.1 N-acetylmuramoyl-L-alanine amidase [Paenibacillus psychroresistens]
MKYKLSLVLTIFCLGLILTSCARADHKVTLEKDSVKQQVMITAQTLTPLAATVTPAPKPLMPLIFLDPGHQLKGNNELEYLGPNSKVKKPKVTSGTRGISTKKTEFQLNLDVSLLLRDILVAKGYRVQMTRDKNEVNLSNKERALMANKAKADLFVRVHADGNDKSTVNGISIQYPIENSSTKTIKAKPSKLAAEAMLKAVIKETGAKSRGIVPRGDLAGFNWSEVPSVLIEMGFMTNKKEDNLMATKSYQEKLAKGMLIGIEQWLAEG